MPIIKKLTSYEIYNITILHSEIMQDYIVYRDLFKPATKTRSIRQTIFENVPIIVNLNYKFTALSDKVDFKLNLYAAPEFFKNGHFISKVVYNGGEVVQHEMMNRSTRDTHEFAGKIKSKSSFKIPHNYELEKFFITIVYHKNAETSQTIEFDLFAKTPMETGNLIDSLSPISKSTTLNTSDVFEKIESPLFSAPSAKRKHRSKSPNSSGWSFGESYAGEENPNIQPIGIEKLNEKTQQISKFLEFQKGADIALHQDYKELLVTDYEMTTEETVNLLKVILNENCEVSANLIVLAVKVS